MNVADVLLSSKEYLHIAHKIHEMPSKHAVPELVIFIQQKAPFVHLQAHHPHKKGGGFLSKMAFFAEGRIGVCCGFGLGGPSLCARMEELVAWGVRKFIYLGVATPLSEGIAKYIPVLPCKMHGEGLCGILAKEGDGIALPQQCKEQFNQFCAKNGFFPRPVIGYSSDFFLAPPHHESQSSPKLTGCDVLDMSSAAFYALGQMRSVDVFSLLVTSDCLCDEEYIVSQDPQALQKSLEATIDIIFGFCLEMLS